MNLRRPSKPDSKAADHGWSFLGVLLGAVVALGCVSAFLMILLVLLGPFVPMALAVGIGFVLFIGLQYLLWGWWLGRALRDEFYEEEIPKKSENSDHKDSLTDSSRSSTTGM